MKKLIIASLCVSFTLISHAQIDCASDRYDLEIFSAVDITSNVQFGSDIDFWGSNQNLLLDVYEPQGDVETNRPVIVFAHGGSFIGGSKTDGDVVQLCTRFAKRGYVCVAFDYRVTYWPLTDENEAKRAVLRATQDFKCAVRYMRMDAAGANTWNIDPNLISIAGTSAGGIMALHYAYMDTGVEAAAELDTTGLGGIEGNGGNSAFSSECLAVVNLCGAIANAENMYAGDQPLVSVHGTADGTVPYATDFVPQVPSLILDGSYTVHQRAEQVGLMHEMYTWAEQDHIPYATGNSTAAYMDTTVAFVSNFLYKVLACTPSDGSIVANTVYTTGINESKASDKLSLYPNPNKGSFSLTLEPNQSYNCQIFSIGGKLIYTESINNVATIYIHSDLKPGLYFLHLTDNAGTKIVRELIIQ